MNRKASINADLPAKGNITLYFVTIDGETFEAFIDSENSGKVLIRGQKSDQTYYIDQKDNPFEFIVSKGSKLFPVSVENSGNELSAYLGCREGKITVKTERDLLYEKYQSSTKEDDKELKIISPLPGLIIKVHAQTGDSLKKGDGLVIIEAMKMENEIQVPRDCVINSINVEEGKTINKGHVIAVLE